MQFGQGWGLKLPALVVSMRVAKPNCRNGTCPGLPALVADGIRYHDVPIRRFIAKGWTSCLLQTAHSSFIVVLEY
jgi:hypothetical protein